MSNSKSLNFQKIIGLCLFIFSIIQPGNAQNPITRQLTDRVYKQFIQNAKDSVIHHEKLGAEIRESMEKSLKKLGYKREFVFLEDDLLFKEGMHKHFKSEPLQLAQNVKRNKEHVKFENNHIKLFFSDQALFRWRNAVKILAKDQKEIIFKKFKYQKVGENYLSLEAFYKTKLKDPKLMDEWVKKEISCQLLSGAKEMAKVSETQTKIKLSKKIDASKFNISYEKELPFKDYVITSYPADGQYNFYLKEFNRNFGYVLLKRIPNHFLGYGKGIKARWTDQFGQSLTTDTKADFMNGNLNFPIPVKFLEKNQVYRLELISATKKGGEFIVEDDLCMSDENFFKSKGIVNPDDLKGSEVLYTIYFRTSIHDNWFSKSKLFLDTLYSSDFESKIEFDEAPGEFELEKGEILQPPIDFNPDEYEWHKKLEFLYNKYLLYYLRVPEITPVDTVNLDNKPEAELNHTAEAAFVRQIKFANPPNPPKLREWKEPLQIGNKYEIPAPPNPVFELKQSHVGPRITESHFRNRKSLLQPSELTIRVTGGESLESHIQKIRNQLEIRMRDRAEFFYLLNVRKRKMTGEGAYLSRAYFLQKEKENLPGELMKILDAGQIQISGVRIDTHYRLPGSDFMTSSMRFDLVERK